MDEACLPLGGWFLADKEMWRQKPARPLSSSLVVYGGGPAPFQADLLQDVDPWA